LLRAFFKIALCPFNSSTGGFRNSRKSVEGELKLLHGGHAMLFTPKLDEQRWQIPVELLQAVYDGMAAGAERN
jgi:hypothetical protein